MLVLIFVLLSLTFCAEINVIVENIESDNGVMYIGLFKPVPDFPNKNTRITGRPVKIENRNASLKFENIKPGKYAISVHHDVNSNGKIDKNFIGAPKEPYGFSNNLYGPFGKPNYKKATITLNKDESKSITIKLR